MLKNENEINANDRKDIRILYSSNIKERRKTMDPNKLILNKKNSLLNANEIIYTVKDKIERKNENKKKNFFINFTNKILSSKNSNSDNYNDSLNPISNPNFLFNLTNLITKNRIEIIKSNDKRNIKSAVARPNSMKRIMNLNPYSKIPKLAKYSWANDPQYDTMYSKPIIKGSLKDNLGNTYKNICGGSSTLFLKQPSIKQDFQNQLLYHKDDFQPIFTKSVKIRNIRKLIIHKTSKI
jgi:hypothetical protein